MATKADFAPEQWESLAYSIVDAMLFVSVTNGVQFWESMGETSAAAHYLVDQAKTSSSTLIRDLAMDAGHHRDKAVQAGNVEAVTLDRVATACATVAEVAPDEVEAYKSLVVGVAEATAEARNGVDDAEANAIDKIKSALL